MGLGYAYICIIQVYSTQTKIKTVKTKTSRTYQGFEINLETKFTPIYGAFLSFCHPTPF